MGYIYVIKNEVGGLGGFKIGKTIDPFRRFKELKIGTKSSLVGLWCSARYSFIEKQLHATYKQFRVPQSEWFALTSSALAQVISKLNSIAEQVSLSANYKSPETAVVSTSVPQTYTRPAVTTTTYQTTPQQTQDMDGIGHFILGLGAGFFPFIGQFCFLVLLIDKDTRNTSFTWGAGISAFTCLMLMLGSANAKPLTNYQLEPAQNVSSLIK